MLSKIASVFTSAANRASKETKHIDEEFCPISYTPIAELEHPYRASDGRLYESEHLAAWLKTIPGDPRSPLTGQPMKSDYDKLVGPRRELSLQQSAHAIANPHLRAIAKSLLQINEGYQYIFVHALRPVLGERVVGLSESIFIAKVKGDNKAFFIHAVMTSVIVGMIDTIERNYMARNSSIFGTVDPLALGWAARAAYAVAGVHLSVALNKALLQELLHRNPPPVFDAELFLANIMAGRL